MRVPGLAYAVWWLAIGVCSCGLYAGAYRNVAATPSALGWPWFPEQYRKNEQHLFARLMPDDLGIAQKR
ncbi:hypothetical protein GCM10027288_43150 [Bordetella tumbae]